MNFLNKFARTKESKPSVSEVEKVISTQQVCTDELISASDLQRLVDRRIAIGVEEVESTMEQMLEFIRKIAEEAEKQGEYLVKSVEIVNESAAFSQQVAVSTSEAGQTTKNAIDIAQKGKSAVDRSINHMDSIKESVENIQTVVMDLKNKSQKIEVIISTIKDIANQTNLLALNAAIEAARAGDQGRGFAVVAEEVRKLAEKSSQSTEEISHIIKDIQNSTLESIKAMEESANQVHQGVEIVKETELTIDEIVAAVNDSNSVTTEINQAAHQQATNIEFLIQTIDDMEQAAHKVLNLTETAAMDAQYQKSTVNNLKLLTKALNKITQTHTEAVRTVAKGKVKELTTMTVLNSGVPKDLDPAISYDHAAINIIANLHLGLVRFGEGNEIIPAAARAWYLEEDGRTWRFVLKRGIKFHNGKELKAINFKRSIERVLDPKIQSPNTWLFDMIDGAKEYMTGGTKDVRGIRVLDDYNLTIKLDKPYNSFVLNLAQIASSIVLVEENTKKVVGAGPYKIKAHHDDSIVFEAFEEYYEGRGFIDQIKVVFHSEDSVEEFQQGNIAVMGLNKEAYQQFQNLPQYKDRVRVEEGYGTYYIGFNLSSRNPLIQDNRMRHAISHAINRELLVEEVTNGLSTIAKGPIPPTILNDVALTGYPYNLKKAKDLYHASGLKVGQKSQLNLHYLETKGDDTYKRIAEAAKRDLQELGIEVKITAKAQGEYLKASSYGEFDLLVYRWIGDTGDPDNFLQPLFNINNSTNFTKYHNPTVQELLNQAINIKNPVKRHETYCQIQRQIVDDAPWISLFHSTNNYVAKPYVKGVKMHPLGFYRLNNIWIEK